MDNVVSHADPNKTPAVTKNSSTESSTGIATTRLGSALVLLGRSVMAKPPQTNGEQKADPQIVNSKLKEITKSPSCINCKNLIHNVMKDALRECGNIKIIARTLMEEALETPKQKTERRKIADQIPTDSKSKVAKNAAPLTEKQTERQIEKEALTDLHSQIKLLGEAAFREFINKNDTLPGSGLLTILREGGTGFSTQDKDAAKEAANAFIDKFSQKPVIKEAKLMGDLFKSIDETKGWREEFINSKMDKHLSDLENTLTARKHRAYLTILNEQGVGFEPDQVKHAIETAQTFLAAKAEIFALRNELEEGPRMDLLELEESLYKTLSERYHDKATNSTEKAIDETQKWIKAIEDMSNDTSISPEKSSTLKNIATSLDNLLESLKNPEATENLAQKTIGEYLTAVKGDIDQRKSIEARLSKLEEVDNFSPKKEAKSMQALFKSLKELGGGEKEFRENFIKFNPENQSYFTVLDEGGVGFQRRDIDNAIKAAENFIAVREKMQDLFRSIKILGEANFKLKPGNEEYFTILQKQGAGSSQDEITTAMKAAEAFLSEASKTNPHKIVVKPQKLMEKGDDAELSKLYDELIVKKNIQNYIDGLTNSLDGLTNDSDVNAELNKIDRAILMKGLDKTTDDSKSTTIFQRALQSLAAPPPPFLNNLVDEEDLQQQLNKGMDSIVDKLPGALPDIELPKVETTFKEPSNVTQAQPAKPGMPNADLPKTAAVAESPGAIDLDPVAKLSAEAHRINRLSAQNLARYLGKEAANLSFELIMHPNISEGTRIAMIAARERIGLPGLPPYDQKFTDEELFR